MSIRQLSCNAAAEPEVATPEDVDSAVEGKPAEPVARGENVARGGASGMPHAKFACQVFHSALHVMGLPNANVLQLEEPRMGELVVNMTHVGSS